jgi:hypothetical protein
MSAIGLIEQLQAPLERQQLDKMRPAQLLRQCRDNLFAVLDEQRARCSSEHPIFAIIEAAMRTVRLAPSTRMPAPLRSGTRHPENSMFSTIQNSPASIGFSWAMRPKRDS